MTDDQFAELLVLDHELQGVEFKGPGPRTDRYLQGKVIRAMLGMANRRDGGRVIIGVDEKSKTLVLTGLSTTDLATWNYDDVAEMMGNHADPAITFDLEVRTHGGRQFVVITVDEFQDIPILCKRECKNPKNSNEQLVRKGACYVRSRHKPETSEIPTQDEMRDLLDLAMQKRLRWFLTQAHAVGLVSSARQSDNAARFAAQYAEMSSPLIDKIHSCGYWQVVIRPQTFVQEWLPKLTNLYPQVRKAVVSLRGWDFPQAASESSVIYGPDSISLTSEWENYIEHWSFYQSAQFVDLAAFPLDWIDQAHQLGQWKNHYSHIQPGTILDITDTVHRFTEIFEFAARLALDKAFPAEDPLHVTIMLARLTGRGLMFIDSQRVLMHRYVTQAPDYSCMRVLSHEELIADGRMIALQEVGKFFERFGWDAEMAVLQSIQAELR